MMSRDCLLFGRKLLAFTWYATGLHIAFKRISVTLLGWTVDDIPKMF
jgi:hypothetical protein